MLLSRFGRVVVAIKENELGYDVRLYKLGIFTIGGCMAGIAGLLFGNCVFVSPTVFSLSCSAQIIIWVMVGGLGTLAGPIIGCILLQMSLLERRALSMRFGGVVAVDDVSLQVAEGELRCLIGPNGAGKSIFFKRLTGQLKPSSGGILWRGRDITGFDSFAIARLGVGIKTQVPSLFDGLTVLESVVLALRRTFDEI